VSSSAEGGRIVPTLRDPATSVLVCDAWLPRPQLEAVHALAQAHFASRREPRTGPEHGPIFSWYSPGQGRHITRVDLQHRETAQAYVENLAARLAPVLGAAAVGYEWWSNDGNHLDWHVDKDETLFRETGTMLHPLWSTVFYTEVAIRGPGGDLILLSDASQPAPYVHDLTGKEIPQKHHALSPCTNRLVVFRRGIPHRIDPFVGLRTSLAVNLWHQTPLEFEAFRGGPWDHPAA
jgi:hypothetical protein